MKIDNQFIEALAAQYWGQSVVEIAQYGLHTIKEYYTRFDSSDKILYLELRSIDSLTYEEIGYLGYDRKTFINSYKNHLELFEQPDVDYLRSIGVLVPFREVSIEEMLRSGKVKLKS